MNTASTPSFAPVPDTKTPLAPKIVRAGGGEYLEFAGHANYLTLNGSDTGGEFALGYSNVPFKGGPPLHIHTREDELFLIESGEFEFQVGDRSFTVGAGDFVLGARHIPHTFTCLSEAGGTLFGCSIQAGFENFFREMAVQLKNDLSITPEKIGAIAANYGIYFDGFDAVIKAPTLQSKVMRAGDGECLEAYGDCLRVLVSTQETGGRFSLSLDETPSLSGPPLHVHEREDETFLIRAGCYEFQIGDARVVVGPGDVVFAPRGVLHTFRAVSAEPGRQIILTTPGGFDDFFRDSAQLFSDGLVSPQSLTELGARYGISYLPPSA